MLSKISPQLIRGNAQKSDAPKNNLNFKMTTTIKNVDDYPFNISSEMEGTIPATINLHYSNLNKKKYAKIERPDEDTMIISCSTNHKKQEVSLKDVLALYKSCKENRDFLPFVTLFTEGKLATEFVIGEQVFTHIDPIDESNLDIMFKNQPNQNCGSNK